MRTLLPCMAFLLLITCSCGFPGTGEQERIREAVARQMEQYPASTLQDIYKGFFQDEFGPGHMVSDPGPSAKYFFYELKTMKSRHRHEAEPCGTGDRFVRVPMDLVKDSLLAAEDFFAAFMASADDFREPDAGQWNAQWQEILLVVEKMDLELPDFEAEKEAIHQQLLQGDPVVHHSQRYTEAYDPHYRIMTTEQWQALRTNIKKH